MGVAIRDEWLLRERVSVRSRLGRVDLEAPIAVWSEDEGWSRGVVRNLSMGGMFVATRRCLPAGARVLARFSSLDVDEPDEIEARVSWSRRVAAGEAPAGLGLEFVGSKVRAAIFVRVLLRSARRSRG
jgi:Tfp pilus assembly protein PilZ